MKKISLEERLALDKFDVDSQPHIKVETKVCLSCPERPCIFVCPAACFQVSPTGGGITFSYEGCLECGSCRIVCEKGAVDWDYPRSGFGICYQYG